MQVQAGALSSAPWLYFATRGYVVAWRTAQHYVCANSYN